MIAPIVSIVYNSSSHVLKARMNLIAALKDAGYGVAILSPIDAATPELVKAGVTHHPIRMEQYGMNPLSELRSMRQIEAILRLIAPVASLHFTIKPNTYGTLAAHRAGVPVINNIAGAGRALSDGNPVLRRVAIDLYRRALRYSSKVFFQNRDDMRLFLDADLAPPQTVQWIPGSGVDLRRFSPAPPPSGPLKFLFIGRLLREKGVGEFLEAALQFGEQATMRPKPEFHIAGEHEPSRLYVEASRLTEATTRESIVYHGAVPPTRIDRLIADAHCVVLPSYYGEGVPRVLLEACASGRPIITTDNVGCRDVIEDGVNGFMIPLRDTASLVSAMKRFHKLDHSARAKMGAAARSTAENRFDEAIVIDAYMEALASVRAISRRIAI